MPPISQFPPARVFLKMPSAIKTQSASPVSMGSLTTRPTGRAAFTQTTTSTTLPPRVASTTKFSTILPLGERRQQCCNIADIA
ncbi:hypothetical protein PMIN03_008281 [Paraphaeosphaeria minitans]|uniref:Uncharacterized protein n=1 Tax=Paraphaeosphaeria minitans TaxID=565426 RepID=A0A9P6GJC5_9PLEO|nr:hypothetical protein PMIN01_04252 [Paraphaeosphaeria minitans]